MNAEITVVIVVCSLAFVFAIRSLLGKIGILIGQKKPDCGCGNCNAKTTRSKPHASQTPFEHKEKIK